MVDKAAPEKDFISVLQKDTSGFLEKAVSWATKQPLKPKAFTTLHETANNLLLLAKEQSLFGDFSQQEESHNLANTLTVMDGLDKLAIGGIRAEEDSVLNLIPEDIVITERGNKFLIEAIGGEEILVSGEKNKKISIEEALGLAKMSEEAELRSGAGQKGWSKKDLDRKNLWESISVKDRDRLKGIRKILRAVGLDPDSITKGVLGAKEYIYVNPETDEEIDLSKKAVVAKGEFWPPKLVIAGTNKEYKPKAKDPKPKLYKGEIKQDWDKSKVYLETKTDGKSVIFSVEKQITDIIRLTTRDGEKILAKKKESIKSVLSEEGLGPREVSLRQLLIDISREKAGLLVDTYLVSLQRRGQRIGWNEVDENRGIVVEGIGFGSATHELLMRVLHNTGRYEKWRAIATLNEQNARFQMFFDAVNRKDAQKAIDGGRLSQLASAENIAAWIRDIPDLAAVLDWQEWQGLFNPRTGEPLDYPSVVYGDGVDATLNQKLADGQIKEIIKRDGTSIRGATLINYQPEGGDIFILKTGDREHKSMALINVLKDRARYYGVEDYVVDLAFAFHRFMFTGLDRGKSYHKAQVVGDYKVIADLIGLGWNIEEDYAQLTKEQKTEFEKLLQQLSIYQTGVKSFFQTVLGYRDRNPQNRDRWFREAWGDRAPLYTDSPDLLVKDIGWAGKVNWEQEWGRREIYRWMGEFFYTLGKGMQNVAGTFAGRETPFTPTNQHHREALINHLRTSPVAQTLLTRVGFDVANLSVQRLGQLIDQIFPDGRPPKTPDGNEPNFLSELIRFNNAMGFQGGLEAAEPDFDIVEEEFRDAVRLEKALESPEIFGNLLKFAGDDGWTPNENLIEKIRGFGGTVNDASYDYQVYYMLYWYATYLVVAENFVHLRLRKKLITVDKLQDTLLSAWQDQATRDVRGTRPAFAFHLTDEIHDQFLSEEIEKDPTQISHDELNKMHDKQRLWMDAVLFYQEPELDQDSHEKMVQEYCSERMKILHHKLDKAYVQLLHRKQIGLDEARNLVDPEGKVKMFKDAVVAEDGTVVGPGEGRNGRDTDKYLRASREARARFMQLASDLDLAGWLYQLDMGSAWNDKLEVQTMTKDAQGLYKYEVMETWYGIVENDVALYNQALDWYKQLKSMPRSDWFELDEQGRYDAIPEILVGFAREYLSDSEGHSLDLRAGEQETQAQEAGAARAFFRRWLYLEDKGGYRSESDPEFNEAQFNKAFQILIGLMFAKDIGAAGIAEDPSKGPNIDPLRYLLFYNVIKPLVKDQKNPDKVDEILGFYDLLMKQPRVGQETWADFFRENNVGFLSEKETIIDQMSSLVDRDKMFSQKYDFFPAVMQRWLGLKKSPGDIDFSMGREVASQLRGLVESNKLNEVENIMNNITAQIGSGRIAGNVESVSRLIASRYGLRVLPRGYWLLRVFRQPNWFTRLFGVDSQVPMDDIRKALEIKLSPTRQARRWVFKNYGIDIGDNLNMDTVYQAIEAQIPAEFRDESDPEADTYVKVLKETNKRLRSVNPLSLFGDRWLDETFLRKPNRSEAQKRISQLYEAILTVPADRYYGVLRQSKRTAQLSRYFYEVVLSAGQFSMTVPEKVKKYDELRGFIPFGQYSWELLDLTAERFFGFAQRPMDTTTDVMLTLEYAPIPLVGIISSALSSTSPFSGLRSLDTIIKRYVDAPLAAFPALVVTVPIAFGLAGGLAGGLVTVGAVAGTYWLTGRAASGLMGLLNTWLDKNKIIEKHPAYVFLLHKGIVK